MTNSEKKILKKYYEKGFVSYKVFFYDDISVKIKALVRSGMGKTKAVVKLSKDLGVSTRTVWYALRLS